MKKDTNITENKIELILDKAIKAIDKKKAKEILNSIGSIGLIDKKGKPNPLFYSE